MLVFTVSFLLDTSILWAGHSPYAYVRKGLKSLRWVFAITNCYSVAGRAIGSGDVMWNGSIDAVFGFAHVSGSIHAWEFPQRHLFPNPRTP